MDVKFYRLGFNKPVADASYRAIAFENEGNNGNVVFAKVDSSIANVSNGEIKVIPPTYYICAAGIEYKVADADTLTKIFNEFEDLVDTSNDGSQYTNVKSVHYWIQEAMKRVDVTAEAVYRVIDASNKIYDPSEGVRYQIERSADGIDVSIKKREGSDASSLLFGVDLDKIYLPTGVQRNVSIGVLGQPEGGKIVTEGVGYSVKELLEYYLVSELFPQTTATKGAQSFNAFRVKVNGFPTDMINHIKVGDNNYGAIPSGTLVEIGTDITVKAISDTLTCSSLGDWALSKESSQPKIEGMTFGYSESFIGTDAGDGHKIPTSFVDQKTKTAATTIATASYHLHTTNLGVTANLKVGNTTVETSSTTDSTYSLSQYTGYTIVSGENKFSLSLTHDASATRDLTNTYINGIDTIFPLSNKGHIAADVSVKVASSAFTNTPYATIDKYAGSSVTYIGVYPIFTNGKAVAANANRDQFDWYNNTYSIEPSNKLNLVDYTSSNQTYRIAFGATNPTNQYKCYMFIPAGMTFSVPYQAELDGAENIVDWQNNTSRNQIWTKQGTTTISIQGNNVSYDVYTENSTSGAWAYKIQINKK